MIFTRPTPPISNFYWNKPKLILFEAQSFCIYQIWDDSVQVDVQEPNMIATNLVEPLFFKKWYVAIPFWYSTFE
jgi:hypothetical protein